MASTVNERLDRRPLLPTETTELPALPPAFHQTLESALSQLGEVLSPGALAAVETHARLLVAWSASINLTGRRAPEEVALEHVADSLAALPLLRELRRPPAPGARDRPLSLLDLGSGAGYPGLPLAVALPVARAALVDSIGKKAAFLAVAARLATGAVAAAGETAPILEVRSERAEALAREPAQRQRWDVLVARAVAALPELVELALPLVRTGGHLVAWKRDDEAGSLERELGAARRALERVGGSMEGVRVEAVPIEGLRDHRLVVVPKIRATPARYPRPPAERRRLLLT